jgi:pimeloyl-ACP methyl ester carboxylesterase
MPSETFNGTNLFYQEFGSGDSLVLVHGSWGTHKNWTAIVPGLSGRFRVILYDRRGHGQSERLPTQGSVHEDVADLAAVIEKFGAPAHIVANSYGASIALRLASRQPRLFRTLSAHEPPLFDLLRNDPNTQNMFESLEARIRAVANDLAAGNPEDGARRFVDTVALGPGAWEQLPGDVRQTFINNASTFLDETRDPDQLKIDLAALSTFSKPCLLSGGSESPPEFAPVLGKLAAALPHAVRKTFAGAGHVPHTTHPAEYLDAVTAFIAAAGQNS